MSGIKPRKAIMSCAVSTNKNHNTNDHCSDMGHAAAKLLQRGSHNVHSPLYHGCLASEISMWRLWGLGLLPAFSQYRISGHPVVLMEQQALPISTHTGYHGSLTK